jgi:hypothetical protein
MKAKEVAKLLAGRINQEHYILGLMNKLFSLGYEKGYKDAVKEACQEIQKNYKPNN